MFFLDYLMPHGDRVQSVESVHDVGWGRNCIKNVVVAFLAVLPQLRLVRIANLENCHDTLEPFGAFPGLDQNLSDTIRRLAPYS